MKHMELANAKSKSRVPRRNGKTKRPRFVLCVAEAEGVEKGKVYKVIPDAFARQHKLIRIIDDSREDYLFPAGNFVAVLIMRSAERDLQGGKPTQKSHRIAGAEGKHPKKF